MKRLFYLIIPTLLLAACGGKHTDKTKELNDLKKQKSDIDVKIHALEAAGGDSSKKATPVVVMQVQKTDFISYVQVQSVITGDQNVYASPQAGGIVSQVLVRVGQHVSKGQVLAKLDAAAAEQQILGQDAQLGLTKTLYEKQQQLWAQNIGTQVQLLQAKANYEYAQKQKAALVAQRNMYNITSPIDGVVDMVTLKAGDATQPGSQSIRVVNTTQLKAEANLGENYLGKIHEGNMVKLIFPDQGDSIKTKLTYVSEAIDPSSRTFLVQVKISGTRLHPNMSCIMKIANYENSNALTVPVSVIQKTSKGDLLYINEGNKAKAVYVTTGESNDGQVEIKNGLKAGDQVIVTGYDNLDNGDPISVGQ
ncbi:MAG: efflux RND transporter periplasmic adaptor subunit [Flavipsychrobacter sp.]|nr:efflux RND transporter periplasmic adaptor subunit [Flavipsychrobacter sp.]